MDILNQICHLKGLNLEYSKLMELSCILRKNIQSTFLYIIDMIVNMQCDTTVQLLLITLEYRLYKSSFFPSSFNLGINSLQ